MEWRIADVGPRSLGTLLRPRMSTLRFSPLFQPERATGRLKRSATSRGKLPQAFPADQTAGIPALADTPLTANFHIPG